MAAKSENAIRLSVDLRGIKNDQEIKVFHGHSMNEKVSITKDESKKYHIEFKCQIEDLDNLNPKTCIFGIYILEKTQNEHGLTCIRIKGIIDWTFNKLQKSLGKTIDFHKFVHNHTLNDEIKSNKAVSVKTNRRLGLLEGQIFVHDYPSKSAESYEHISNDHVKHDCINPWYQSVEHLKPVNPIMKDFHVPWMRFISGPIIPFSCAFLWKNRYFENFENNVTKCQQFVDIIMTLLSASVSIHADFDDINDFFNQCSNVISEDKKNRQALICLETIFFILTIKCVSEPYITDLVRLVTTGVSINVDQMTSLSLSYGCDCEDGDKYAYELKRLITDSDWGKIISTLNGNSTVSKLNDTVVMIFRMLYNFHATMFCGHNICHSVNVLIDIDTVKTWIGIDNSRKIKPNEQSSLSIMKDFKIFFNESTSFSSPFQKPYHDYYPHLRELQKYYETVSSELGHVPSLKVYDYTTSVGSHDHEFYKYFTNFVTTDLLDVFPNVLDFAPITDGNLYGIALRDVYSNRKQLSLRPRLELTPRYFSYFDQLVNGHHPNFDLIPHQFELLKSYFKSSFESEFNEILFREIKVLGLNDKNREPKKKTDYFLVSIYPIGGFKSLPSFCQTIAKKIKTIVELHDIECFVIKIERLYKSSNQSFFCCIQFF